MRQRAAANIRRRGRVTRNAMRVGRGVGRKSCEAIGAPREGQERQLCSEMNVTQRTALDVGHDERQLMLGAVHSSEQCRVSTEAAQGTIR